MPYNSIICRYNEIATKGNNRSMFENALIRNMKRMTKEHVPGLNFVKTRGRIFIHKNEFESFSEEEETYLKERLQDCFGLDSFSFCIEGERTLDAVLDHIRNTVKPLFEQYLGLGRPVKFRTRARRSDKSFPLRSKEIEIEVATMIEEMYGENKVQVDLMDPDISIGVEIREKNSTIFLETVKARGGLPVGSNSPLLGMLSGGIDSPVACTMAMKRGCRMDFLTFHSYPYTPIESVTKVWRIAKIINRFQPHGVLYACNLSEVQKLIRDNCDPKFRTVLYRRPDSAVIVAKPRTNVVWQSSAFAVVRIGVAEDRDDTVITRNQHEAWTINVVEDKEMFHTDALGNLLENRLCLFWEIQSPECLCEIFGFHRIDGRRPRQTGHDENHNQKR